MLERLIYSCTAESAKPYHFVAPGKGTRIQVYIPLSEEAADRLHHAKR